jgi:hypothetical protein
MIKRLYLETRATTSSSRLARITLTTRNSTTTTSIINRNHAKVFICSKYCRFVIFPMKQLCGGEHQSLKILWASVKTY